MLFAYNLADTELAIIFTNDCYVDLGLPGVFDMSAVNQAKLTCWRHASSEDLNCPAGFMQENH